MAYRLTLKAFLLNIISLGKYQLMLVVQRYMLHQ
nr:MAG TPA: hypothetical protein [Caudoviricetes sp.]